MKILLSTAIICNFIGVQSQILYSQTKRLFRILGYLKTNFKKLY